MFADNKTQGRDEIYSVKICTYNIIIIFNSLYNLLEVAKFNNINHLKFANTVVLIINITYKKI